MLDEAYWITINNKGYPLHSYSARIQDEVYKKFRTKEESNGFKIMQQMIANQDPTFFPQLAYLMLKDKTDFPTYEMFYKAIDDIAIRVNIQSVVMAAMQNALPENIVKAGEKVKKKSLIIAFTSGILIGAITTFALLTIGHQSSFIISLLNKLTGLWS